METNVRVWRDGETSTVNLEHCAGYDQIYNADTDSVIVDVDRCDALYNEWSASDYMGSFFNYVCRSLHQNSFVPELTFEDKMIFARRWKEKTFPNFHCMLEGDHSDFAIMQVLNECTEMHGGKICADDLNLIERNSYVYWISACEPDYDFDPIYYT